MLKSLVTPAAVRIAKIAPKITQLPTRIIQVDPRGSLPVVRELAMGRLTVAVLISSLQRRPCGG